MLKNRMLTLLSVTLIALVAAMAILSQTMLEDPPSVGPGVSHDLAIWRATRYSDVRYKLNLTLEKLSPVLKGTIEIRVTVSPIPFSLTTPSGETLGGKRPVLTVPPGTPKPPIVLDWRKIRGHEKDSTISNVSVNGRAVRLLSPPGGDGDKSVPAPFEESNEHLIFRDGVVAGENVIKLDFTSPILTSGSAITRYIDKEDGSEYLYSLFVPSDASTAFPVFDQPDLKARFQLTVWRPEAWKVVSNTTGLQIGVSDCVSLSNQPAPECPQNTTFSETWPISTYVFAFAAGPFAEVSEPPGVAGDLPKASQMTDKQVSGTLTASSGQRRPPTTAGGSDMHIYVRKSQAEKFKPHAAETFRLMREGVKYLEGYFDYKFPWPKYDLVLIPEFPFGGMEHAGATFVREQSIIFPTEPTKSDYINRATLIFHETAHQWFGDTVTMKWFDDLWLKEGFANFMAYKAMEKIMPETNAWKVFYERIKQPAYATDSTKGTTPIYQPIANLSAAKSAYGNIVYNKAPAFLRQAEFYLGEDKFQTAVRAFLKKHEFANGTWEDLVKEFETASGGKLGLWGSAWVTQRGLPKYKGQINVGVKGDGSTKVSGFGVNQSNALGDETSWDQEVKYYSRYADGSPASSPVGFEQRHSDLEVGFNFEKNKLPVFVFPNYQDYGYGLFLLDDKSRDYVLKNVQNEKDPFLRSMMYGALWDSVREGELDPKEYVALVIRNLPTESDENIAASVLGRSTTAINFYLSDEAKVALTHPLEDLLEREMLSAKTSGRRITFYRSFLNIGASIQARETYKKILVGQFWSKPATVGGLIVGENQGIPIKSKDKFDLVTRLASLGDPDAPKLLADLEKTETSDDAKRYAYAAHAAFATKENREKFWNDFTTNRTISESWIEAAMAPFNSIKHDDLSLPYLQRALAELPNLKRDRKIFFVNGWLGAFIGGQKSQAALDIVNKFLADNPNLDNDLRLKILENVDVIERAVKIRAKYGK